MQKTANVGFLKHAQAADALAVDVRTIERWMKKAETRQALSAVRYGKQCRIPRPENLRQWEAQARERLEKLGIKLKPGWLRELNRLGTQSGRYLLESYRFWLAACIKVLESGSIPQEARNRISLLWLAACEILNSLPRLDMELDKLKAKFPAQLLALGLPKQNVPDVMSCWPVKRHFERVRTAHTLKDIEKLRRMCDFLQATRCLKQNGQKPTAENLRPLLHKDIMAHLNDTSEKLTGIVIKAQSNEQLRAVALAAVCDQIADKKTPGVTVDSRQPQAGLPLRTFRKRHPLRQQPQRYIIANVYGISSNLPNANEKP